MFSFGCVLWSGDRGSNSGRLQQTRFSVVLCIDIFSWSNNMPLAYYFAEAAWAMAEGLLGLQCIGLFNIDFFMERRPRVELGTFCMASRRTTTVLPPLIEMNTNFVRVFCQ